MKTNKTMAQSQRKDNAASLISQALFWLARR